MTIEINEVKVERNELGPGRPLATAGGMLLGFLPTRFLVNVLNLGLAPIVVPVFAGTLVGLAQWIALRRFPGPIQTGFWRKALHGLWDNGGMIRDPEPAEHGLCRSRGISIL